MGVKKIILQLQASEQAKLHGVHRLITQAAHIYEQLLVSPQIPHTRCWCDMAGHVACSQVACEGQSLPTNHQPKKRGAFICFAFTVKYAASKRVCLN